VDNRRKLSRPAQIIRYLETRLSASNDALASHFGVGTKTITNDIRDLNVLLETSGTIEIQGGRYRLCIIDPMSFGEVRDRICQNIDSFNLPTNRYGHIVRRLLNQTSPTLIDDLVEEMSIGRSTVVADLTRLKKDLAPYALRIVGVPNVGIELIGDELQVRLFVLENMFDAVYADYPLDDDFIDVIEDAASGYYLDAGTTESFTRWFTVMIDRVLTDHALAGLPDSYLSLKTTPAFALSDKVVNAIGRRIQVAIPAAESIFLALPIAGMRTPADARSREQFPFESHNSLLVQKILDRIASEMDLHVPADGLLKEFVYHITFMQNRMRYRVHLKDLSLHDIEVEYPVAFRMAEVAKRVIEQETELTVIEDELGFIASYFQVFLEEKSAESEPFYSVAIVCASGLVSARLIQTQLRKVMSERTDYELVSLNDAGSANLDRFDLVVTTQGGLVTSTSVIELGEFFDRREFLRKLNQLRYDKQLDIPIAAGAHSLLASILDRSRFFILSPNKSYLENTLVMVDHLVLQGAIDAGFRQRLLAREAQSTMALDDRVAFPHLANTLGTKVVFAMGVVPRAPGEAGVRVIFLMGLPDKADYDDTMLVNIYDEIIRLAGSRSDIDLISRLTSYEEFFFHMARTPQLTYKTEELR